MTTFFSIFNVAGVRANDDLKKLESTSNFDNRNIEKKSTDWGNVLRWSLLGAGFVTAMIAQLMRPNVPQINIYSFDVHRHEHYHLPDIQEW